MLSPTTWLQLPPDPRWSVDVGLTGSSRASSGNATFSLNSSVHFLARMIGKIREMKWQISRDMICMLTFVVRWIGGSTVWTPTECIKLGSAKSAQARRLPQQLRSAEQQQLLSQALSKSVMYSETCQLTEQSSFDLPFASWAGIEF